MIVAHRRRDHISSGAVRFRYGSADTTLPPCARLTPVSRAQLLPCPLPGSTGSPRGRERDLVFGGPSDPGLKPGARFQSPFGAERGIHRLATCATRHGAQSAKGFAFHSLFRHAEHALQIADDWQNRFGEGDSPRRFLPHPHPTLSQRERGSVAACGACPTLCRAGLLGLEVGYAAGELA